MKKEDFKVGQAVYVYLIGNDARGKKTDEERIEEWEAVSIGKRYIQARRNGSDYGVEKFDMKDNFKHKNLIFPHWPQYELYPTKEELIMEIHRRKLIKEIDMCMEYHSYVFGEMTDEELETVHDILKKYERREYE